MEKMDQNVEFVALSINCGSVTGVQIFFVFSFEFGQIQLEKLMYVHLPIQIK